MIDRTTELALQIADNAASSDIECHCVPSKEPTNAEEFRTCFYDIQNVTDPETAATVATALEYLELRGLLRRHPDNPAWVRPIHHYETAEAA
jgi:hypothetical protein